MSGNLPPNQIIHPQFGPSTKSVKISRARATFNGQKWRGDMRRAAENKDWDAVSWLIRHHDMILAA